jgi:hypothetical protein
MTNEEFVKLLEERGDKVYIVDRGLMRFGKFVAASLGLFVVVGLFFFGFDLKNAADEASQARRDTEKTLDELKKVSKDLDETKTKLTAENTELEKTRSEFLKSVETAKSEMRSELDTAAQSAKRMLGYEQEILVVRLRIIQSGDSKGLDTAAIERKVDQQPAAPPLAPGTTVHLALVSQVAALKSDDLGRVAAALQKQVQNDLKPEWGVDATIEPFDKLERVPAGYWPVIIQADMPEIGAAGFHNNKDDHPFALVGYSPTWTITASHEVLDMLVDPFGNRLIQCPSPNPADGGKLTAVLVEIAQPVEAEEFAYSIDGVTVSDFVTPNFYDGKPAAKYSHTGAASKPLTILKGGYISWEEPVTKVWYQQTWFTDGPEVRLVGKVSD